MLMQCAVKMKWAKVMHHQENQKSFITKKLVDTIITAGHDTMRDVFQLEDRVKKIIVICLRMGCLMMEVSSSGVI